MRSIGGGMTPFFSDDWLTIYGGDCREVLRELPSESVDCVVTSPPYWGLRDYGTDGQLGLERTPEEYVANMVEVFREVRRVLKPSGTCWLNLGDTFAANRSYQVTDTKWTDVGNTKGSSVPAGLKPKDLVGIPWRVAFALQADGWYLRSDIIWSKPNPMPESVTDRPTKAHEYLFLLTKSARYYFDADAVRENAKHVEWGWSNNGETGRLVIPGQTASPHRPGRAKERARTNGKHAATDPQSAGRRIVENVKAARAAGADHDNPFGPTRNLRSVWTIATRPYPGAHFAVFPPELPERCIKAGSPEHGTILDPFAGSGTVGMVANRLSRRAILIDLNPEYLKQQMARNAQTPLGLGAA